jgi:VirE N-terminal domain/Protein of unknown function (DUF3987)
VMNNPIADIRVSLFASKNSPNNPRPVTVGEMLNRMSGGQYKSLIEPLRRIRVERGAKAYKDAKDKTKIPGPTYAGTFSYRSNQALIRPSGLATLDWDDLGDSLPSLRREIIKLPYVVAVFVGPSNDGLKALCRIPLVGSDAEYKRHWRPLARDVEAASGVPVDPSGKDIARLCYVSHDPDLFFRDNAEVYTTCEPEPAPRQQPVRGTSMEPASSDEGVFYKERAVRNATYILNGSRDGTRHASRLRAGYLLGGYVAGGFFTQDEALDLIRGAVETNTATPEKAIANMKNYIAHGMSDPISIEDLRAEREVLKMEAHRRRAEGVNLAAQTGIPTEPVPLQREISPAAPYPIDALGNLIAPVARRIMAVVQAPDAMCAQAVLAAVTLAVQAYRDVVIDGRTYPLSEYYLTLGDSGERKTACDRYALCRTFQSNRINKL